MHDKDLENENLQRMPLQRISDYVRLPMMQIILNIHHKIYNINHKI